MISVKFAVNIQNVRSDSAFGGNYVDYNVGSVKTVHYSTQSDNGKGAKCYENDVKFHIGLIDFVKKA